MKKFLISILFLLVFTLPTHVMSQDNKIQVEQEDEREVTVRVDFEKLKVYENLDLSSVQTLAELIAKQEINSIGTNNELRRLLLPNTIELVDAIKWQQGINRFNYYSSKLNLPVEEYINLEKQKFRSLGYTNLGISLVTPLLIFLVIISTKYGWKGQWIIVVFSLLSTLITCYTLPIAIKYLNYTNAEVLQQILRLSG